MKQQLIPFLLFLVLAPAIQAQKLADGQFRSMYTYIFRLDSSQTRMAFEGVRPDSALFLRHLADSFHTDSAYDYKRLGWGTYFFVRAQGYRVAYNSYELNPFITETWGSGKHNFITLKDLDNNIIEDAVISLADGRKAIYTVGTGSYLLPEMKKLSLLKIEQQGKYQYIWIQPDYYKPEPYRPSYPNYSHTTILPGYIVFNQPRFKHNDTVKFKAMLVNDDGSYYTRKISIYLKTDYDKQVLIGKYKPVTPGAYTGQFVMADSFAADRSYELLIKDLAGETLKSNSFYLENYELKKNTYSLSMPDHEIVKGETVTVVAMAKDANGLPVMDGSIRLSIKINNMGAVLQDRLFVPNAWYQSYYTAEKVCDPSGYTIFEIPDSLFHKFNASYAVSAEFTDADNELIVQNTYFNYSNTAKTYYMQYVGDSLYVRSFFESKPSRETFRLQVTHSYNRISSMTISTPFTIPVDPTATAYALYIGDSLITSYNTPPDYAGLIQVHGRRSADSVFINIDNPSGLPVYYEIYAKDTKVAEGKTLNLRYSRADKSATSYYIVWTHNLHGNLARQFSTRAFHLFETRLNVDIRQPAEIYPGQQVAVSVKVSDQSNKPVDNVNLTAYAVNTQFGDIPLPDVPYLGLQRQDNPVHTTNPSLSHFYLSYDYPIQAQHIKALRLYSNEIYKLFYGPSGRTALTIPIKRKKPELAVYLHSRQSLVPAVYIKVDDKIVYHRMHKIHSAYSFPVASSVHDITVRTYDRLLSWKQYTISDSNKHILCFNLDSILSKPDTSSAYPGRLSKKEWEEFLSNTLFVHIDNSYDTLVLKQGQRIIYFGHSYSTVNQNIGNSLLIDNDYFTALGPLEQGSVNLSQYNLYEQDFRFEPYMLYFINSKEVRSFPTKKIPEQLRFFGNDIPDYNQYRANEFTSLSYDPDTKQAQENTENVQKAKAEPFRRERPHIEQRSYFNAGKYGNDMGDLNFINVSGLSYDYLWLINKESDSASVINTDNGYTVRFNKAGSYELLLFNDSMYCLVKDLKLQVNGTNYLFIRKEYFKYYDTQEIWPYEQIVKSLTRIPLRAFTDTPYTIEPLILKKTVIKGAKLCKLKGTVLDVRYRTPVDYTEILAEVDGVFKGGAVTNEDGDFEMDKLPPGNYMLKLRAPQYRYQVVYNLKLEKGTEAVLNIKLFHMLDEIRIDEEGLMTLTETGDAVYNIAPTEEYASGAGMERPATKYMNRAPSRNNDYVSSSQATINNLSGINFNGARADGAGVFIDGIRVQSAPAGTPGAAFSSLDAEKMQQRLEELSGIAEANRIRNNFRDYGYWVPNLITDKNGAVYFTVTFPDNITSWKTIVPAMNGKRQTGLSTMVTRSFKPLSGNMAVPFYLTEGDKLMLKSRIINYTGKDQQLQYQFISGGNIVRSEETSVGRFYSDSMALSGTIYGDTLKPGFMLSLGNGYKDGESREVPVRPNGILLAKSKYIDLDRDTSLQYIVPADAHKAYIMIHNDEVEQLLQEIEELKQYSYGCTEQTASKLRALLAEKAIKESLGLKFTDDKLVRQMMSRLNKMRNKNGTWSWWDSDYEEDNWLTMYVAKTLNEARLAGYSNNIYIKAAARMETQLPSMPVQDQLYTMNLLRDMERSVAYDTLLKHIKTETLSTGEILLHTRLLQKLGKPYSISTVTQYVKNYEGTGLYWGENVYNYKYDIASNTLIAYDILSHNDSGKIYLSGIKNFISSDHFERHTLARANLVSLYASEWQNKKDKGSKITGLVSLNRQKLKATDFPYKKQFAANDTISLSHSGNKAYATIITQKIVRNPNPDSTHFRISSSINNHYEQISLNTGKMVTVTVSVDVFQTSDNVMIEIPLPAGFSYYSKPKSYSNYETHREYFYDKTSIFCARLPRGKHSFSIQVVPKFSGTLNMPPAKVELMYYPEIHNNEKTKVITVIE